MDSYYEQNNKPPSHYEYVTGMDTSNSHWLKQRAFDAMHQLEGWCTDQKAAILIDLVLMKSPETIVEIGVFGGKSLVPMAFALKEIGKGKIYGIDPWSAEASTEGMDGVNYEWWHNLDHDGIFIGLMRKIFQFNLISYIDLIRSTSANAPLIPNIDILHIDGNHSERASYIDVTKWVPLVNSGGLIIFDDINWTSSSHDTNSSAVAWLNKNCIKFAEFRDNSIWAIWIKP